MTAPRTRLRAIKRQRGFCAKQALERRSNRWHVYPGRLRPSRPQIAACSTPRRAPSLTAPGDYRVGHCPAKNEQNTPFKMRTKFS